jgi:hypothetical protein
LTVIFFGEFKSAKKHLPSKIKIRLMAGIKKRDAWRELMKKFNILPHVYEYLGGYTNTEIHTYLYTASGITTFFGPLGVQSQWSSLKDI